MNAVGSVLERKDRPAYVRFERRAVEDLPASKAEGRYVAKDVDFVLITPPYSKDEVIHEVEQWLLNNQQHVQHDRLPREWAEQYEKAYRAWQNGQELPLSGIPIKGWGVISPAQQETLIQMRVMTVEDLAQINDEGMRRVGMGSLDLKHKAQAWLTQLQDKGPLVQEIAAVKAENGVLKGSIETLTRQVEELTVLARNLQMNPPMDDTAGYPSRSVDPIAAADILDTEPAPRPKGKR